MQKNRVIAIITVTIILLLSISIKSFASTGKITGETVKLREGANLDSKLVVLLSVNDKVEVLGEEGDWYKVKFKEKLGYVYKDYIEVKENVRQTNNNIQNTVNEVNNNTTVENQIVTNNTINSQENNIIENENIKFPIEKVVAEELEVKLLPLINSITVYSITKDTKVTVTENINGWASIQYGNVTGWIRFENLKNLDDKNEVKEDSNKEVQKDTDNQKENNSKENVNRKAYVNVTSVNLRAKADVSSEVIISLNKNTEVIVTSEDNNWSKVKYDGKEGYISKKYLSDKKVEDVTNRSSSEPREKTNNEENKKDTNNVENSNEKVSNNIKTSNLNNVENVNSNENILKNTNKNSDIVDYAKKFLGVKYVYGGSSPSGFDCSGFTSYVYKHFGYNISRTATAQSLNGKEVQKSNLQLGDLVIFRDSNNSVIGHVGIYIGGNQFIHASSPGDTVKITSLSQEYYLKRYVTARRII